MNSALKYYGLTILWALFIFTLCSIKMGSIGESTTFFPGFDKLVHCGMFFTLTVLSSNSIIRKQKPELFSYKWAFIIWAICIFYGGLIEILQLTVFTWRDGDWNDFFADTLGASMGIFGVGVTALGIGYVKK